MKKTILASFPFILMCCALAAQEIRYDIPKPEGIVNTDDTLKVYVLGDVMMHSRQMDYDHRFFFRDIVQEMSSADICIANMEFSVAGEPYSGYPCFSAPEYLPEYMAECGTDVFLLANNHISDRGKSGLDRTIDFYLHLGDSAGTVYTGIGHTPLIIDTCGFKLALLNFTYGTNTGKDERVNIREAGMLEDMFSRARSEKADFIIALPHWGEEYKLQHNETQEEWAGWLVRQGADVIIGSHPHVVQDTSHISGVPVIYSLGNAVSNMSATNTRLALAVTLTFINDLRGKRMLEPELQFLWCTLPGTLTESYSTIDIKKWANRRGDWLIENDFINMSETLKRVTLATGIHY